MTTFISSLRSRHGNPLLRPIRAKIENLDPRIRSKAKFTGFSRALESRRDHPVENTAKPDIDKKKKGEIQNRCKKKVTERSYFPIVAGIAARDKNSILAGLIFFSTRRKFWVSQREREKRKKRENGDVPTATLHSIFLRSVFAPVLLIYMTLAPFLASLSLDIAPMSSLPLAFAPPVHY